MLGKVDPSPFQPGAGAPSPPPPPPPAPAGNLISPRAPQPLQAPGPQPHGASPPPTAAPLSQLSAQIHALLSRVQVLEREAQEQRAWRSQAEQVLKQQAIGAPAEELEEMVQLYEAQSGKLQELEAENQRLRDERRTDPSDPPAPAQEPIDLSDLPIVSDPMVEAKLKELAEQNNRLQAELDKTKKSATAKFKRLKGDMETIENQKKNLMQALAARDAATPEREITLEEITASEVFKGMVDNIKTTSRNEVTILHDAIKSLRKVDPKAYNAVLTVVARTFEVAKVENPLALLPRAPE